MPVPDDYKPSDTMPESRNLRAADFKINDRLSGVISDVTLEVFEDKEKKDERGDPIKHKKLVLSFQGRNKYYVTNNTQKQVIESYLGLSPNKWIGASIKLAVRGVLYKGNPTQGFVVVDATPKEDNREPGSDDEL